MSAPEDNPPNLPPRVFPEHAETIPPPAPRPTMRLTAEQREQLDAEVVKHEAKRVAETLDRLDKFLPQLDAGVKAAIAAAERAEAAVDRLRADMHLWLFGDGVRPGVSQGVEATNRLAKDALDTADRALKVATETYNAVLHGPAAEEGKRGSLAPDAPATGAGRSSG